MSIDGDRLDVDLATPAQIDGKGVHGPQELLALPIRFLSVVAHGDVRGQ